MDPGREANEEKAQRVFLHYPDTDLHLRGSCDDQTSEELPIWPGEEGEEKNTGLALLLSLYSPFNMQESAGEGFPVAKLNTFSSVVPSG